MTDNEIVKAVELEVNKKSCIHEQYEEACGLWCKHYHKWCEDMSGKNKKNNCSAFKPTAPTKRAKATLDLINRQKAELKATIAGQETLQKYIAEQKAEIERLQSVVDSFTDIGKMYSEIKAEAYKEFAERLKEWLCIENELYISSAKNMLPKEFQNGYEQKNDFVVKLIDNLLKEMVGE